MPKLPSNLRIGGIQYSVVASDSLLKEHYPESELEGLHLSTPCQIILREGLPPSLERATALHEVIHAIDQVAGVDLDEQDVTSIATILFCFILDNPEFVAWLSER